MTGITRILMSEDQARAAVRALTSEVGNLLHRALHDFIDGGDPFYREYLRGEVRTLVDCIHNIDESMNFDDQEEGEEEKDAPVIQLHKDA